MFLCVRAPSSTACETVTQFCAQLIDKIFTAIKFQYVSWK